MVNKSSHNKAFIPTKNKQLAKYSFYKRIMDPGSCTSIVALLLILHCFCLEFGASVDTITSSQYIKDPEAIVSAGNKFKLGFFSPVNSTNRYVAIWYSNISITTPVWVSNRNKPLNDSSGIMTISEDGNLVVLNGQKEILWSSNVSIGINDSRAQLMDDGNLVLGGSENGNSLWQSFQEPSDTYMPKMKLTANSRTGKKMLLTSWTSVSDPSIGSISGGIDPSRIPQFLIWNGSRPIWRTGPWNGQVFIGIPEMVSVYFDGFNIADEGNGTFTLSHGFANESLISIYILSSEGKFGKVLWDDSEGSWRYEWQFPKDECDFYGKCGPFGSCDARDSPICSCLKGFEPKNADEWNNGNWTNGCSRRRELQCERIQNGGPVGKEDGFLKLERMKVPDFSEWLSSKSEQTCKNECLNINCSCIAYSYYPGFGCMLWRGNLTDLKKFHIEAADLYIRLADSEIDNKKTNMKVIISLTVVVGVIAIAICVFYSWRRIDTKRKSKKVFLSKKKVEYPILSNANMIQDNLNHVKLQELPLFSLQTLIAATDNFNTANKLGQGGFGPVYKGILSDGQEIAVKRLSRSSGQGLEEFMNEVVVISKLQHRNLVRILGGCVEGEEKMVLYEYMPNKSLDAFLFDPSRKQLLDWKKRFNIVEGICRGLLYLHRDSRLRIIHRDLKASNILLDQELNPKISDFGMARIFGNHENQANTTRVVGTYGYMPPEYAMEGRFSEKSDVFSFGVLLLEIISGRKNSSFYGDDEDLSLLGYAWKLWNQGNIAALVDPGISYPSFHEEIFRCVHVGLLCVQEFAKDRPAIFTVISMLKSEIVDLPTPKQPAFSERRGELDTESFQRDPRQESINNVTVTLLSGR